MLGFASSNRETTWTQAGYSYGCPYGSQDISLRVNGAGVAWKLIDLRKLFRDAAAAPSATAPAAPAVEEVAPADGRLLGRLHLCQYCLVRRML